MADSHQTPNWWASLKHGGLLLSAAQLIAHYSDPLPPLPRHAADRLRREINRFYGANGARRDAGPLLDAVLEDLIGLGDPRAAGSGYWQKGPGVSPEWTMRAVTGEAIRPRRVWENGEGFVLPVFVDGVSRVGIGHGKRSAARVLEWLRKADRKLALLTNGEQWRLIYAGLDHDAYAEWDTSLWFEEGEPGDQVTALRTLLGPRSLLPPEDQKEGALLLHAAEESRKGQKDFSSEVGERIREAIEHLIRAYSGPLDHLKGVGPQQIYLAATRVVMRLVVALFAESRDLLPRNNAIYHGSYGVEGLREELDRLRGSAGGEWLRHRHGAWPRLVALFRLIHEGSPHEALPVPRYGGDLFWAGDPEAEAPLHRALAVFEEAEHAPSDAVVLWILDYLSRGRMRVRQGRRSTWVEMPVDFSALSSEYIGILYEGLLDYQLRQAPADDAIIFLNLGDEPALPLSRLSEMDDAQVERLVEQFKTKQSKRRLKALADEGSDEEQEEEIDAEDIDLEDEEEEWAAEVEDEREEEEEDRVTLRAAAEEWAARAVKLGGLVRSPSSSSASARREWEAKGRQAARSLVKRIVLPREWYLVRFGSTRKGSGTFYTKPQLAIPTVQRALLPLAYEERKSAGHTTAAGGRDLRARPPEEILRLKVCDPACGSGSFLVASLRFLTDALFESLHQHGRIQANGASTLITLAEGAEGGERLDEDLLPTRPDAADFEARLKARLKRYVVERCIHGVDIDSLAVELCRVSLWVETMDPELPLTFIDHKIRCGNSLVGCWFDRVLDYPALCCERSGGDAGDRTHDGVHFEKNTRGEALKRFRNDVVKPELREFIQAYEQISHDRPVSPADLHKRHDKAVAALRAIHHMPIHEADRRRELYRDAVEENEEIQSLRVAMDTWCAAWFWSADRLDAAPTPLGYLDPPGETARGVEELRGEYRFFHWELEFPDVFTREDAGFDALVGNPPWEIMKPESKAFFSNIDPLYRAYGKQEALVEQEEYFEQDRGLEREWLDYRARYKALSNWVRNAAYPYGDGKVTEKGEGLNLMDYGGQWRESRRLHKLWGKHRSGRDTFGDPRHPFRHQGSADLNTYKLFLEVGHALLRPGGRLGMLLPSGLYTDQGSTDLRALLLMGCRWDWLFGFENREKVFDIDSRAKFCALIAEKKGTTEAIQSSFMHRDVTDWELGQAERHALAYPRPRIEQYSPNSWAILELQSDRDLEVLTRLYENGVLLGDEGGDSWGLEYAREFDMTNDSELFPPRPKWEAKGYQSDEYGHWLKGPWRPYEEPQSILERSEGLILSPDGDRALHVNDIEDVALPLYEGRMIGQFDFSQKGWVSGKGRSAKWRDIGWDKKVIEPQYLMGLEDALSAGKAYPRPKVAYMRIGSATNTRTMYSAYYGIDPAGDSVFFLRLKNPSVTTSLLIAGFLDTYAYDYLVRARLGGLNLSEFVVMETPLPRREALSTWRDQLLLQVASLMIPHRRFAIEWKILSRKLRDMTQDQAWSEIWALTPRERLRHRCIVDAVSAELYGLTVSDFRWIIRDCDYPVDRLSDNDFTRRLDPKGFWRVDKDRPPELRQSVLSLIAFHQLKEGGLSSFLGKGSETKWDLPEQLRLADYGLGHDGRAREPRPVRAALVPRHYDQQLGMAAAESWEACSRHAALVERIVPAPRLIQIEGVSETETDAPLPLFRQG